MVRAIIGGDCSPAVVPTVKAVLDDSCRADFGPDGVIGNADVWPDLELRLRTRTGFDDDGVAQFGWRRLAASHAMLWEERTEVDSEAGVTRIRARAILSNDTGITTVPESAVLAEIQDGLPTRHWEITSTSVLPDRIEVEARRFSREVTEPEVEV